MPIISTKTTTIPGLPAPTTPDLLAYGVSINPNFPGSGVSATMMLTLFPYRANGDGSSPQKVGSGIVQVLGDFMAFLVANPTQAANFAAAKAALDTAVQAYVTERGL